MRNLCEGFNPPSLICLQREQISRCTHTLTHRGPHPHRNETPCLTDCRFPSGSIVPATTRQTYRDRQPAIGSCPLVRAPPLVHDGRNLCAGCSLSSSQFLKQNLWVTVRVARWAQWSPVLQVSKAICAHRLDHRQLHHPYQFRTHRCHQAAPQSHPKHLMGILLPIRTAVLNQTKARRIPSFTMFYLASNEGFRDGHHPWTSSGCVRDAIPK